MGEWPNNCQVQVHEGNAAAVMLAADLAERDRVVAADHATIQSLCGSVVDLQKHKFVLKFQTEVHLHHLLGLSLWYKSCTCGWRK